MSELTDKQRRYYQFYINTAFEAAKLSFAIRRKVGAIAVSNGNILGYGFNGTPAGYPNVCEDALGHTLPSVIHAEDNLLRKIRHPDVLFDVFVTKEPCENCARLLAAERNLRSLFWVERSKSNHRCGLAILEEQGVFTMQLDKELI